MLSRLANAKNDKEAIAAWKLDLIRILQVFNVRSVGSVRLSLTVSSQTELTITTNVIVSDIRRDMLAGHGSTQPRLVTLSTRRLIVLHLQLVNLLGNCLHHPQGSVLGAMG